MSPVQPVQPTQPIKPRFCVFIPARLASSRLPNKPLADIAGRPMVVHVAQRALASQAHRVVVATDSPLVLAACQSHGIEAVLTREDHPSGSDRLAETCDLLGLGDDELVVNVQGDEPLIDPQLIDAVAQRLADQPEAAMGTAAHALSTEAEFHNPNCVKVVCDRQGLALYFSRAPIPWPRDAQAGQTPHGVLRHVGIYAYRAGFLRQFPQLEPAPIEHIEMLEQLRALWHGHRIAVHVCATAPGAGVDTPEDLERVRRFFTSAAA